MARKPAILERAGALTPRDRMWAAIRRFGIEDSFSTVEIAHVCGLHVDTVLTYILALERGKYLACVDTARRPHVGAHKIFGRVRLVRDTGVDAPRVKEDGTPVEQGAGRDQMWRAVRALKEFDWRALALAASTEKNPITEQTAKDYVRYLRLAGYLRIVEPARRGMGNSPEVLRFIRSRDTGPRAPIVTREKQVMDANTGAIVYEPKKSKEDE